MSPHPDPPPLAGEGEARPHPDPPPHAVEGDARPHPGPPPLAGEGEALRRVAQRRILFGHQSIGANILDGIARLAREQQAAGLRIAPADASLDGPAIAHLLIGQNGRPLSKIAHFDQLLSTAVGDWAEIAFFKFCYVDFHAETNVPRLFESYQRAHELRVVTYPGTIFVHVTAPLTVVQQGPKGWLKTATGSAPTGARENVTRNEYNDLLRRAYGSGEPLFDLARVEADGEKGSFERSGQRFESLSSAYTNDGGHLNTTGELAVATQLVDFLSALPAAKALIPSGGSANG